MTRPPRSSARPARAAGTDAATTLLAVGALHAAWGLGYSWPLRDRAELVDAVVGAPGAAGPDTSASYAMAALLGGAAALVAFRPGRFDRPRRVAVVGIAGVMFGRGVLGLTGHTNLVVPISTGRRFRQLDRRFYSPLCLTLAGLAALSLTDGDRGGRRKRATSSTSAVPAVRT